MLKRFSVLVLLLLTAGCGLSGGPPVTPPGAPSAAPTEPPIAAAQAPSPTAIPTETPALTPDPTSTPLSTATPTPFPMSIQAMREGSYPGSDITLEQELAAGANYRRYYASYLSQGLKIYGLLTAPVGDPPAGGWPAIVFNHGYIPPKQYVTTERYVAYVNALASHGYIVFKIDYRGNDRSEGEAHGAYGDPGYTVDVLNAVASLERFSQANPHKIGMWGHSMGGYLTLRAMVISPDIKAGVIWAGVVGSYADMLCCWRHPGPPPTPIPGAPHWRQDWTARFGTPAQNPAFWDSISATAYLADLSGPLQLHHDQQDSEVPFDFSRQLAEKGEAAGKTVELYLYPGDDHNLAQSFSAAMQRTLEFFDRYLK